MKPMKHYAHIAKGTSGETSKITEEMDELRDAHAQQYRAFVIVEAADVINALGKFTWQKYRVPMFAVIALYYARLLYKPMKRLMKCV